MKGALLVTGTASDAGKSVVVAGICRWLARQGVRVAPFKAQNMALNAGVTPDGGEIGRAQIMQAAAARVPPEVAMNPVLLKPTGERTTQVVVLGRPAGTVDAQAYSQRKHDLLPVVLDALADLRRRFDVVVCEGAGSPAEINLRHGDLVNMGLARAAGLPTVVVGDIDRGGVLAAFQGTLALLEPADQALITGFIVNKFRGDPTLLATGLERLQAMTGRPTFGVLPWAEGLELDVEDSLSVSSGWDRRIPLPPLGPDGVTVAVAALRRLSNVTDVDALTAEPGVVVRLTTSPVEIGRADLVIVPGTKATVDDLALLRRTGMAAALERRARTGAPILAICGGYQMLGRRVVDPVESGAGEVSGLGLLPVETSFHTHKVLRRPRGTSRPPLASGLEVSGYEIRHGRVRRDGGQALLQEPDGADEGCVEGAVLGTSWHGLLEHDAYRRALLTWVAARRGLDFRPGRARFAEIRDRRLDVLGDLVEEHLDTAALGALIAQGAPSGLPVIPPAGASHDERTMA